MEANTQSPPSRAVLSGRLVLVVEDDPVVAQLVDAMLSAQECRVRVVRTVTEAESVLPGQFDAVLLDIDLPDGSGFELLPQLHTSAHPLGVVIMTGNYDRRTAAHSIRAGITEYLHKPFRLEALLEAISAAIRTTGQWRKRMADAHDDGVLDPEEPVERDSSPEQQSSSQVVAARLTRQGHLTSREHQVLSLILAGQRNAEIAAALDISVHTVKYHARNVLSKLGLESRLELFRVLAQETSEHG